jgi:hypothetical protein
VLWIFWWRWEFSIQHFLLRDSSGLLSPGLEFETLYNDIVQFLWSLLSFGGQHNGSDSNFKSIMVCKGVLGIKPIEEYFGSGNGHPRQFQDLSCLFHEATGFAAFNFILLVGF